jgi:hypothetical protein
MPLPFPVTDSLASTYLAMDVILEKKNESTACGGGEHMITGYDKYSLEYVDVNILEFAGCVGTVERPLA